MRAGHKPPSGPSVQVWRVSPAGRVAGVATTVFWLALVVGITVHGKAGAGLLTLLWIILSLLAFACWQWAFVPYVALTTDEVVVQNRFDHRSIPYAHIVDVKPGYGGVHLMTKDRDVDVVAWAVQKSNLKKWQRETDPRRRLSRRHQGEDGHRGGFATPRIANRVITVLLSASTLSDGVRIGDAVLGFVALCLATFLVADPSGLVSNVLGRSRGFWARRNPTLGRLATWGMSERGARFMMAGFCVVAAITLFVVAGLGR